MDNIGFCCGEPLTEELPMKKSDVRICKKCENIRDVGAARKAGVEHVEYEMTGKDPKGKFNSRLGVWVSS